MTYTISIADHHGSNLTREETEWPAFNDQQEYCGQIYRIAAWSVPARVYRELKISSNHLDLYLSSEGHWAATLEHAEHYLSSTKPPIEFLIKGSCLNLFAALQWVPNAQSNYRVYRRLDDGFDVEEVEELPIGAVDFEYF
jgi:hypothetical protein